QIALERERMLANVENMGLNQTQRDVILPGLEKQHEEKTKAILAASNDERWKRLRELKGIEEAAKAAREHYSPIALATSHGLGSEERSRISSELQGLGPAAMKRMADRARLEGNRTLAASLTILNRQAPPADRSFSNQDLAESVFREDSEKAMAHIAKVE